MKARKYPYMAHQQWNDVFFMHWPLEPEKLTPYIPRPLELDTFDKVAWITIVCFVVKNSQLRGFSFPIVPFAIQTNVRTYVRMPQEKEPGVYFLNLYLNHRFAARSARRIFNLPFRYVEAGRIRKHKTYTYQSKVQKGGPFLLHATFEKSNRVIQSDLIQFLTERYVIWNRKGKQIIKVPISHDQWQIKEANVTIQAQNVHPLIQGMSPRYVHAGDWKLTHLYPYESVAYFI